MRTQKLMPLLPMAALSLPLAASAQAYPAKTIRVIIPAAPGDSCDTLSRLVGYKVAEKLGQQFAIDNRAGAGGQLGLELIARVPADGYTMGCGQGGNMVIVPLAYKKVAYDFDTAACSIGQAESARRGARQALAELPSIPDHCRDGARVCLRRLVWIHCTRRRAKRHHCAAQSRNECGDEAARRARKNDRLGPRNPHRTAGIFHADAAR